MTVRVYRKCQGGAFQEGDSLESMLNPNNPPEKT